MTVRQLLDNMDSREIMEWQAYYKVKNELLKEEKPQPKLDTDLTHSLTNYRKPNTMKAK